MTPLGLVHSSSPTGESGWGARLVGSQGGDYQEQEKKRLDCRAARAENRIAPAIMSGEELILVTISSDAVSFLGGSQLAAWEVSVGRFDENSRLVWVEEYDCPFLRTLSGGSSARNFAWWTRSCKVRCVRRATSSSGNDSRSGEGICVLTASFLASAALCDFKDERQFWRMMVRLHESCTAQLSTYKGAV